MCNAKEFKWISLKTVKLKYALQMEFELTRAIQLTCVQFNNRRRLFDCALFVQSIPSLYEKCNLKRDWIVLFFVHWTVFGIIVIVIMHNTNIMDNEFGSNALGDPIRVQSYWKFKFYCHSKVNNNKCMNSEYCWSIGIGGHWFESSLYLNIELRPFKPNMTIHIIQSIFIFFCEIFCLANIIHTSLYGIR